MEKLQQQVPKRVNELLIPLQTLQREARKLGLEILAVYSPGGEKTPFTRILGIDVFPHKKTAEKIYYIPYQEEELLSLAGLAEIKNV